MGNRFINWANLQNGRDIYIYIYQGYKNPMIRVSARAHRPSRAQWDFGEVIRILVRRWHHSSSPGMPITFNPRPYKLAFLSVWHLHCHNRTIKMKQGQLSNFFKKLTLVPESSNGDERVQPGATVETRASPPKQKQPAARPKILVHSRPSAKRDHGVYDKSKRTREFQDSWLNIYNYLRYDKEANIMYCEPCREFAHLHPSSEISMIKGMFSLFSLLIKQL